MAQRTGVPAPELAPLVQGSYYLLTGLWPVVHLRSFEAVTGPKVDKWLVKTFGALTGAVGAALLFGSARKGSPALRVLGLTSALIIDGAQVDTGFANAARNIPNVDVLPVQGINVYDIVRREKLVLTKAAVEALEARFK